MQVFVTVVDRTIMVGGLVHAIAARQSRKAAYEARQKMRELVPVDSGALSDSIEVTRVDIGEYMVSAGGGEVDYAAAVEFGTWKMAARPYFTPGMEAGRQVYERGEKL